MLFVCADVPHTPDLNSLCKEAVQPGDYSNQKPCFFPFFSLFFLCFLLKGVRGETLCAAAQVFSPQQGSISG